MYRDGKFITRGSTKIAEEWALRMARTLKNMQGSNMSKGMRITVEEFDPKKDESTSQL